MTIHNHLDRNRPQIYVEFPSGPVPLGSNFYIERHPIEGQIDREITQPGSVIRIKAPRQMGKSSLLLRLLDRAKKLNYRTAYIDFLQAENEIFSSLDKFLRWFCANVSRQLQLPPMLDDYWDEDIGSKVSSTVYFQGYLLDRIDTPLVLALNEVNRMFEYPNIAQEFLSLLRSWYEEAKQDESLQKLRLVLVHSTEVYINFDLNQSPFNIGLPVRLPEFNLEQTIDLARCHGLDWTDGTDAKKLIAMVGGHPYLVRLVFYHLVNSSQSLDVLLENAHKITGIYSDRLREYLAILQKHTELGTAVKLLIADEAGAKLDSIPAYKLESMGIVKLDGDRATFSCNLYRQFFASQNFESQDLRKQIESLQQQIKNLQQASHTDRCTQVANRSYFETHLKQVWQKLDNEQKSVTLIICELDFFKVYSDRHGQAAADNCLQQVARAIRNCISKDDLVARYNWAEFAVVLPARKENSAFKISEQICLQVKQLAIPYNMPEMGGFPSEFITVSLGVVSTIPNPETSPETLIRTATEVLNQAKRQGGNRVEAFSILNDEAIAVEPQ